MSRLAELAIASLDDPDAAVVLGDFVLENKWSHRGIMVLLNPKQYERASDRARRRAHFRRAGRATVEWARAVLAALIFGEWPHPARPAMLASRYTSVETSDELGSVIRYQGPPPSFVTGPHPWAVMDRCRLEDDAYEFRVGFYANLATAAYNATGISVLFDPNVPRGTLFGINRELAPQRLAGQNLGRWTSQIDAAMAKLRRDLG